MLLPMSLLCVCVRAVKKALGSAGLFIAEKLQYEIDIMKNRKVVIVVKLYMIIS